MTYGTKYFDFRYGFYAQAEAFKTMNDWFSENKNIEIIEFDKERDEKNEIKGIFIFYKVIGRKEKLEQLEKIEQENE